MEGAIAIMGKIIQLHNKKKEKAYPITTTSEVIFQDQKTAQDMLESLKEKSQNLSKTILNREKINEKDISDYGPAQVASYKAEKKDAYNSSIDKIYNKLVELGSKPESTSIDDLEKAIKKMCTDQEHAGFSKRLSEESFTTEVYAHASFYTSSGSYFGTGDGRVKVWDKNGNLIMNTTSNQDKKY